MTKAAIAIVGLVLSFSAANAAGTIVGSWSMPSFSIGPETFQGTITFADGSVTLKNVCSEGGESVEASVSAPATYTANSVSVVGQANDDESRDGINCNASLKPASMSYSLSADGSTLTLVSPGQPALTLRRQ